MKIEIEGEIIEYDNYDLGSDINAFISEVRKKIGNRLSMIIIKENNAYRLILKQKV